MSLEIHRSRLILRWANLILGFYLCVLFPIELRADLAFGAEVFNYAIGSTSNPPGACALTAIVPAGSMLVVIAEEDGNDYHVTNVSDRKGNTYKEAVYYHNTQYSAAEQSIWYATVKSALSSGDTVMITWSGLGLGRAYAINIAYLTGVSTLSGSATANAWMGNNAISVAGRTRAANTIIIGALIANDFKWSIARGGTVYRDNPANIHYEFFTKPVSSAGMVDPGGTGPIGSTYSGVWAAFSGTCDPAGKC